MNNNTYLKAFIAGSAFPTILSPMLYLGIPTILFPQVEFSYFEHILTIAILIGLLNVLFTKIKHTLPFGPKGRYLFFGALHGFVFTMFGNFYSHIPTELYLLERPIAFLTIPIATVLYACIWRYIIRNVNIMLSIENE